MLPVPVVYDFISSFVKQKVGFELFKFGSWKQLESGFVTQLEVKKELTCNIVVQGGAVNIWFVDDLGHSEGFSAIIINNESDWAHVFSSLKISVYICNLEFPMGFIVL